MFQTLVYSSGLPGSDVELRVRDSSWIPDAVSLVEYIVAYVESSGRRLGEDETFGYGFWLLKFTSTGTGNRLSISEYALDVSEFVLGADLAMSLWRTQHDVCNAADAVFSPPRADQMVAVSDGVAEGDAVQGVRYPAPPHMSGWYFTTDRFDGDIESLRVEHLNHALEARPDLAKFVALPPGFRFDTTGDGPGDVWFDQTVPDQVAAES